MLQGRGSTEAPLIAPFLGIRPERFQTYHSVTGMSLLAGIGKRKRDTLERGWVLREERDSSPSCPPVSLGVPGKFPEFLPGLCLDCDWQHRNHMDTSKREHCGAHRVGDSKDIESPVLASIPSP